MSERTAIILQIGMLLAAFGIMLVIQWRQVRAMLYRVVGWQPTSATIPAVESAPVSRPAQLAPVRVLSGTRTALMQPPDLYETLCQIRYDDPNGRYRFPIGWGAERSSDGLYRQVFAMGSFINDTNHILITAKSDVGKDNLAITMLLSLAMLHTSQEVQFCIIDGKGLDFSQWLHKVHVWRAALEPAQIQAAMAAISAERERRRRALVTAGVTKWDEYEGNDLPLLVCYISELSLLQDAVGKNELTTWLNSELAAGRAFGIRFIIATQTASNFDTRWRSQVDLHLAGFQTNDSQDEPNTGLTTKALRERGAMPPSELPGVPDGQGVFTAVHGRNAFTIRAIYVPSAERRTWLARMPNRPQPDTLSNLLDQEVPATTATNSTIGQQYTNGSSGKHVEATQYTETSFPAEESGFTNFTTPFTPTEIAQIVASIASGKGKTDVIRSMPRYSGRKHKEYASFYDTLYSALQDSSTVEVAH